MPDRSTLVIRPDSARVDLALLEASRREGFVDAGAHRTFAQLLEALDAPGWARLAPADPWLVRALIASEAASARSVFGELALTAEFALQADLLRGELFAQDVSPNLAIDLAARVGGRTGEKLAVLATLFDRVDELLARQAVFDRRAIHSLATRRLKDAGLPLGLQRFSAIEVRELHDLPPARLVFLDALARACVASGRGFRLVLPWAGSAPIDAFVGGVARFFEKRWDGLPGVELVPDAPTNARAVQLRQLFATEPRAAPVEGVSVASCATPRDEAAAIASGIKRELERGTPPERIGVAFRDLADDSEVLIEHLDALGIPVRARLGLPLAESPVGRLVLSLLSLAEDDFSVESVATLIENRYAPRFSRGLPACRPIFAEAGVRDDLVGQRAGEGGWSVRLGALLDRRTRDADVRPSLGAEVKALSAVLETVRRVLALGRSIPARAAASTLLEAWWKAVGALGIDEALSEPSSVARGSLAEAEIDRAIARDQASFDALGALVRSLRQAFDRTPVGPGLMERRTFHRWLSLAFADVNLEAKGPRAGAVWLIDARELPGAGFDAMFFGGLVDGRLPGRSMGSRLFSDDERAEVNAAAGMQLFRLSVMDDGIALPLRLAEDRFLFHQALVAAPSVTLTLPRSDARGRELLRSPFLDALERVVQPLPTFIRPHRPIAPLEEVETPRQLAIRAALEAWSPLETRQSARDPRAGVLLEALRDEPWIQTVSSIAAIEAERLRFFTAEAALPGRFSGGLDGPVLERLTPALEWDAPHPVSASQLENWSKCHFLGLGRRVLKLEADEEASEELDHRAAGQLLHAALKRLIPALQERGQFPPTKAQLPLVNQLLDDALRAGVDEVARTLPLGHHVLFDVSVERARRDLERLIFDSAIAPFVGAQPRGFEVVFGKRDAAPRLEQVAIPPALSSERPVFVTGAIDRLDVAPAQVAVVDYKLTASGTPKARLDALLLSDFQLPLYLFVARTLHPDRAVDAAWVGLRKSDQLLMSNVMKGAKLRFDELLATDELTRRRLAMEEKPNLANSVHALQASLRKGDFGARPLDCRHCQVKSVCRISARRLHDGSESD